MTTVEKTQAEERDDEVQERIENLKGMSLAEACDVLFRRVYNSTRMIEELQLVGKISGNGHHARQLAACLAVQELETRWKH